MTEAQHRRFYLPAWSACAKACQWNTQAGIWGPGRNTESMEDRELLARVLACAKQIAQREHRGPKTDDFRRACHIVAIGANKSSLDFTNDEVERVVALFRVLTDPLNLNWLADWADPLVAKKRNLIAAAKRKAPEAYVLAIMKDKYHTSLIEDLNIKQLQSLCFTLNKRKEGWVSNRKARTRYVPQENPF
jgi:hypothetical protein